MTAVELQTRESELERIEQWRTEMLERAGYTAEGAATLAARLDINLHSAIDLLEQGCPPDVALRILL